MAGTSSRVIRNTAVVGFWTMVSRCLGLAREILMAAFFGTSLAQSAFVVAFTIPNLFRRIFGEGALTAAFVPTFAESLEREGPRSAWQLAGRVMLLLTLLLGSICVLGVVAADVALARGVSSPKAVLVLSLLRIMLPYALLMCLVALSMGALNTFHHFLLPAASPTLLNAIWIAALGGCALLGVTDDVQRIHIIAWAVLAAGVAQLAVQVPPMVAHGFRFEFSGLRGDRRVVSMALLMAPAAVGLGVTQINVFVDRLLAMWIGSWAPAALGYAERLIYLPLGVFATALSTVLLPVFSRQIAQNRPEEVRATLGRAFRSLLLIVIPSAVGMLVLAGPIVRAAYQRGSFTAWDTVLTARAVAFYAPGLVAFSVCKAFIPAFYGMKDTRTPVRVGVMCVLLNVTLNITFILTWPEFYRHAGLALATVVSESVNGAVLAWILTKRIGSPGWRAMAAAALRYLVASVGMGAAAWLCCARALAWLGEGAWSQLASLALALAVGATVYAVLILGLCRDDAAELIRTVRGRRRRGAGPAPAGS